MRKHFRHIRVPTAKLTIILSIIAFIVLGAINGVLGNLGTAVYSWLVSEVPTWFTPSSWLWAVLALSLLVVSAFLGFLYWSADRYSETIDRLIEMDDWFHRLISQLVSGPDLDIEMQRLMEELLRLAVRAFGSKPLRAAVFVADANKKQLHMRYSYRMPNETIKRTAFDVEPGKVNVKRGVAGEAFLDPHGAPQVAHFSWKNDKIETDKKECYILFDDTQSSLEYQSCVCIPLTIGARTTDRLGVLCFDSQNRTLFDAATETDSELQQRLVKIAARFAAAFSIYQEILKASHLHSKF
jgi:transcriptional regulator with GAF, ATPase, and Fis domain